MVRVLIERHRDHHNVGEGEKFVQRVAPVDRTAIVTSFVLGEAKDRRFERNSRASMARPTRRNR